MEISDDTKLFLRAVLTSAPGMRQSQLLKEYTQTTGDRLEYTKYGFRDLYGFLAALEGEVTRLEFSPKHEENLVYAVLDQTKYSSKHAKKYASKVKTGLEGKSQAEIIEWKKQNGNGGGGGPVSAVDSVVQLERRNKQQRNNGGGGGGNRSKPKTKPEQSLSNKSREGVPTLNDWLLLRCLSPESDNRFTLSIRNIGVNQGTKLEGRPIYTLFAAYNVIPNSFRYQSMQNTILISFPSYFTAYRAWKEKDKTIIVGNRIGVEPVMGNLKALTCQFHVVFVINLPSNVTMSSFVTIFAKYSGLIWIEPRPHEHCAIISYSTLNSAQRACHEIHYLNVNGKKHPIIVQLLDSGINLNNNNTVNNTVNNNTTGNTTVSNSISDNLKNLSVSTTATTDRPVPPVSPNVSSTPDVEDKTIVRGCGFCINYEQFFQMYHITCRNKLYTINSLPNEVKFLVTYQVDPIRFWAWLISDSHETVKKLHQIETKLLETVVKIQPPHVLPKEGQRGASCFKEDGKESWYRCYILSSDTNTDTMTVFYCDYGNCEVISREQFRSTYNDVWVLPPQAVPFKLNGFELINPESFDVTKCEILNLRNLNVYTANVVKDSVYSEGHIVEIKSIKVNMLNSELIDNKLIGSLCKPVGPHYCGKINHSDTSSENGTSTDNDETNFMTSIFDYDEDDLVLGLLIEAHNPSLLYLKLGDVSQFAILQTGLDNHKLVIPKNIIKGDILLLGQNKQVRRVMVLQISKPMEKVKVLHVDFGTIEWVPMVAIFNLEEDLKNSPFQARPASLLGINCHNLDGAISYLKTHNRLVIKANIIKELSKGKICVELFDPKRRTSINKEMVDLGYATLKNYENCDISSDDEIYPNSITIPISEQPQHRGLLPLPKPETTPELVIIAQPEEKTNSETRPNVEIRQAPLQVSEKIAESAAKTNSNINVEIKLAPSEVSVKPQDLEVSEKIVQPERRTNSDTNNVEKKPVPPEVSVKPQDSVSVVSWHSQQHNPFQSHGDNNTVNNALPIANLAKSSKVETWLDQNTNSNLNDESSICNEQQLDGQSTDANEDHSIDVNSASIVSSYTRSQGDNNIEIEDAKQKWAVEKAHLLEIKNKVEGLLSMSPQELVVFYKERKKNKLQQKTRIRLCQKLSQKLENEHESIIQETNQILSLI